MSSVQSGAYAEGRHQGLEEAAEFMESRAALLEQGGSNINGMMGRIYREEAASIRKLGAAPSQDVTSQPETPWWDCKVAFGINDGERFWRWVERGGQDKLPKGWQANETDISGAAGYVAIFRVEGVVPSVEDGNAVLALLTEAKLADGQEISNYEVRFDEMRDQMQELLETEARHHGATVEFDNGDEKGFFFTVEREDGEILSVSLKMVDNEEAVDESGNFRLALEDGSGEEIATYAPNNYTEECWAEYDSGVSWHEKFQDVEGAAADIGQWIADWQAKASSTFRR
jgi:hypothetical protein